MWGVRRERARYNCENRKQKVFIRGWKGGERDGAVLLLDLSRKDEGGGRCLWCPFR